MPFETLPLPFCDSPGGEERVVLGPGAVLLRGFARGRASELLTAIEAVAAVSPFRNMMTPSGWTMSVAMTNCGEVGWVTDRAGYRYDAVDPATGLPWPAMPQLFVELAANAAQTSGFDGFRPDACLINRYVPGARLSLHQDRDERDHSQPVVSLSLGLPAVFLWGGNQRSDKTQRVPLLHGDVVVWGGPDRLRFHGIHPLAAGEHKLTGACRYNITFRRAL